MTIFILIGNIYQVIVLISFYENGGREIITFESC